MNVIIKNMEMPTDGCKGCIFVNRKWLGDICPFLKRVVSGNVERGGFQTDCPLVPVPPHGRLIDADALMETFRERKRPTLSDGEDGSKERVRYLDFISTLQAIKDAPTIIAAEEGE